MLKNSYTTTSDQSGLHRGKNLPCAPQRFIITIISGMARHSGRNNAPSLAGGNTISLLPSRHTESRRSVHHDELNAALSSVWQKVSIARMWCKNAVNESIPKPRASEAHMREDGEFHQYRCLVKTRRELFVRAGLACRRLVGKCRREDIERGSTAQRRKCHRSAPSR